MGLQNYLVDLLRELTERGYEPWCIERDGHVLVGLTGKGEVHFPKGKVLEEGVRKIAEVLDRWAKGDYPFLGYGIHAQRGDGEFRFELFTEREVRWLEFQAWLVDMGYYQKDLVPENDSRRQSGN